MNSLEESIVDFLNSGAVNSERVEKQVDLLLSDSHASISEISRYIEQTSVEFGEKLTLGDNPSPQVISNMIEVLRESLKRWSTELMQNTSMLSTIVVFIDYLEWLSRDITDPYEAFLAFRRHKISLNSSLERLQNKGGDEFRETKVRHALEMGKAKLQTAFLANFRAAPVDFVELLKKEDADPGQILEFGILLYEDLMTHLLEKELDIDSLIPLKKALESFFERIEEDRVNISTEEILRKHGNFLLAEAMAGRKSELDLDRFAHICVQLNFATLGLSFKTKGQIDRHSDVLNFLAETKNQLFSILDEEQISLTRLEEVLVNRMPSRANLEIGETQDAELLLNSFALSHFLLVHFMLDSYMSQLMQSVKVDRLQLLLRQILEQVVGLKSALSAQLLPLFAKLEFRAAKVAFFEKK